jgi:ribonuclease-3
MPDDPRLRVALTSMLGVEIGDMAPYRRALTHRSVLNDLAPGADAPTYERLEFLGDALLDLVVSEHLMDAFPEADEGFLSKLRAKLVSKGALATCARRLGVGPHLRLGANARRAGVAASDSVLADAVEALAAALYLDRGLEAARAFAHRALLEPVDLEAAARRATNYKSRLLEHAHAQGHPPPTYRTLRAEGPSHDRTFTAEVLVAGAPCGTGTGPSKKAAEQAAARAALERV